MTQAPLQSCHHCFLVTQFHHLLFLSFSFLFNIACPYYRQCFCIIVNQLYLLKVFHLYKYTVLRNFSKPTNFPYQSKDPGTPWVFLKSLLIVYYNPKWHRHCIYFFSHLTLLHTQAPYLWHPRRTSLVMSTHVY